MQPGEALLTGQVNGQQLGNALFQFLPCFPHEGPPMPRVLAKQLFPNGFLRPAALTMVPPPTAQLIPPAGMPAQPAPAQAAAQVIPQPVQAQPQPAPAGYRSINSGGNPIGAISQRRRIVERKGL